MYPATDDNLIDTAQSFIISGSYLRDLGGLLLGGQYPRLNPSPGQRLHIRVVSVERNSFVRVAQL